MRSNRPNPSQRGNQPYTVRQGGMPDGSERQPPPHPQVQAIACTIGSAGVAAWQWGGSARSSPARHLTHRTAPDHLLQARLKQMGTDG
jgi:hypothetical protein